MKTTAFANELTKISVARPSIMRGLEALTGAAAGAATGAAYVRTTGRTKGWDEEESAGTLAGAVTGVGAALLASHGIRSSAIRKAMKNFRSTKRFMDSASQLTEGSSVMSRPALIKKQIQGVDTQDVFPQYFHKALAEENLTPDYLKGLLSMQRRVKDIGDTIAHDVKVRSQLDRLVRKAKKKGLAARASSFEDDAARLDLHIERQEEALKRLRQFTVPAQKAQARATRRAEDLMQRHSAHRRTQLTTALETAESQIQSLQEGHKKMVADALAASRARSSKKYFGIL